MPQKPPAHWQNNVSTLHLVSLTKTKNTKKKKTFFVNEKKLEHRKK